MILLIKSIKAKEVDRLLRNPYWPSWSNLNLSKHLTVLLYIICSNNLEKQNKTEIGR